MEEKIIMDTLSKRAHSDTKSSILLNDRSYFLLSYQQYVLGLVETEFKRVTEGGKDVNLSVEKRFLLLPDISEIFTEKTDEITVSLGTGNSVVMDTVLRFLLGKKGPFQLSKDDFLFSQVGCFNVYLFARDGGFFLVGNGEIFVQYTGFNPVLFYNQKFVTETTDYIIEEIYRRILFIKQYLIVEVQVAFSSHFDKLKEIHVYQNSAYQSQKDIDRNYAGFNDIVVERCFSSVFSISKSNCYRLRDFVNNDYTKSNSSIKTIDVNRDAECNLKLKMILYMVLNKQPNQNVLHSLKTLYNYLRPLFLYSKIKVYQHGSYRIKRDPNTSNYGYGFSAPEAVDIEGVRFKHTI